MKLKSAVFAFLLALLNLFSLQIHSQNAPVKFEFEGNTKGQNHQFKGKGFSYAEGVEGQSLSLKSGKDEFPTLSVESLSFEGKSSFSVRFWMKTNNPNPAILLSQKNFLDKGIPSQKNEGWALYTSGGALAWCIGSGERRLNYERDNGTQSPLTDGNWHQVSMTYEKELTEVRLYLDGKNIAIYKVGFEFFNENPLVIGTMDKSFDYEKEIVTDIKQGAKLLQSLVDEFNRLEVGNVREDEFLGLIVDPKDLYERKLEIEQVDKKEINNQEEDIFERIKLIQKDLSQNPYTVSQNHKLTALKPVHKIYELKNGTVELNAYYAHQFGEKERLYPADFTMDNLTFFERTLSAEEIWKDCTTYKDIEPPVLEKKLDTLTVAVWNIWHGGKHFTMEQDGWDSRLQIAEILKKRKADIVLMQETYSSGDFIAAELGYYFATTSDWDYKYQGSNISVLSRYPIQELQVPEGAEFMNVGAKVKLSQTQDIYAMSNWYGMSSFPIVYDFHEKRFKQADKVPILFGGDFNAVPHTDGGDSPASRKMLENGFTDAFRSLYPDLKTFPGYTHQWGERIDQLYFKGNGLRLISSDVISTAHGGFPSDHFIILSKFVLNN